MKTSLTIGMLAKTAPSLSAAPSSVLVVAQLLCPIGVKSLQLCFEPLHALFAAVAIDWQVLFLQMLMASLHSTLFPKSTSFQESV